MTGITATSARNGEMLQWSARTHTKYAARTAMLPWAKLMIRMTPNMNERPHAISA
jgi:hypothetical protein